MQVKPGIYFGSSNIASIIVPLNKLRAEAADRNSFYYIIYFQHVQMSDMTPLR
jgi:hypothetical protein